MKAVKSDEKTIDQMKQQNEGEWRRERQAQKGGVIP